MDNNGLKGDNQACVWEKMPYVVAYDFFELLKSAFLPPIFFLDFNGPCFSRGVINCAKTRLYVSFCQ